MILSKSFFCLTLSFLGCSFSVYAQQEQPLKNEPSPSVLSGQICKENNEQQIVCYTPQPAETSVATGDLNWFPIHPYYPDNMRPEQRFCLQKKSFVLGKFKKGALENDLNFMTESLDWTHTTLFDSEKLLPFLENMEGDGQWYQSRIINWNGPPQKLHYQPYFKWVVHRDQETVNAVFQFIQKEGCWFITLTSPPSQVFSIPHVYSVKPNRVQISEE